jgi:hypothetical protein
VSDPRYPNRPEHPDFWLLSQVLIDNDAVADSGESFEDIMARYIDVESVAYAVNQRALRAVGPMATNAVRAKYGAVWLDGFLAGVRYQHAKHAETPP